MTILEIVLASVLLALVSGGVASVIGYLSTSDLRRRQRAGAMEVASRLTLQYLDDESQLPDQTLPYDDGTFLYRWAIDTQPVELAAIPEGVMEYPEWQGALTFVRDTKLIRVRVYRGLPDGAGGAVAGDLLAELTRLNNPMPLASKNPDHLARLLKDPAFLTRQQEASGAGPAPPPGAPAPRSEPRSAPRTPPKPGAPR